MKKLWPDALRAWVGPPWRIIIPLFFWGASVPAAEGVIDRTSLFQELVLVLYTVAIPLALWLHPKLREYAIGVTAITLTVCIFTPLAAMGNAHFFPLAYCVFLTFGLLRVSDRSTFTQTTTANLGRVDCLWLLGGHRSGPIRAEDYQGHRFWPRRHHCWPASCLRLRRHHRVAGHGLFLPAWHQ